jgi:hypothetical protein
MEGGREGGRERGRARTFTGLGLVGDEVGQGGEVLQAVAVGAVPVEGEKGREGGREGGKLMSGASVEIVICSRIPSLPRSLADVGVSFNTTLPPSVPPSLPPSLTGSSNGSSYPRRPRTGASGSASGH